jgi:hypothetical protein
MLITRWSYRYPNNISVERVFGELDTKIKQASNCNVSNIEACLMYKNNNTGQWLEEKSDIEQQHIINDAGAKHLKSRSFSQVSSIKTFDFSTLYTTLQHAKLKTR